MTPKLWVNILFVVGGICILTGVTELLYHPENYFWGWFNIVIGILAFVRMWQMSRLVKG